MASPPVSVGDLKTIETVVFGVFSRIPKSVVDSAEEYGMVRLKQGMSFIKSNTIFQIFTREISLIVKRKNRTIPGNKSGDWWRFLHSTLSGRNGELSFRKS